MLFIRTHISSILLSLAVLFASIALSACFEIPSKPNGDQSVKSISVYIEQGEKVDSTLLKIHPQNSAKIVAVVHPDNYSDDLKFNWYRETSDNGDSLLGSGEQFSIKKNTPEKSLPNKLVATDAEGNSLALSFNIIINSPPKIDSIVQPLPQDTLYGNKNTSFLFEWQSHDLDNENITHTVLIDKKPYVVGDFNSIRQSGFENGNHTFQVIVTDNYGDSDTSSVIKFFVTSKKDEKK